MVTIVDTTIKRKAEKAKLEKIIDEAREIVPLLKGKEAFYMRTSKFMQEFASTFPHLYFDELRDYSGNVSYKITLRLWSND